MDFYNFEFYIVIPDRGRGQVLIFDFYILHYISL